MVHADDTAVIFPGSLSYPPAWKSVVHW